MAENYMMPMLGNVSVEAMAFMNDIYAVCIKHKMQIAVSDYDKVHIYKLEDGENVIHASGLVDKTRG